MSIEYLINSVTIKKTTLSKNQSDIVLKQSKINSNNKSIFDYKKKITTTKNLTTIKNYYSKIASLEKNNESLNKEISNIQKKNITLQKDIARLEKEIIKKQSEPLNLSNNLISIDDMLPQEREKEKMEYNEAIKIFCKFIKKNGLVTKYGKITNIINPGQEGGNGRVLYGILNNQEVAIKILFNSNTDKDNRFFNEFVNVFMTLQKAPGIVEMYLYDTCEYEVHNINYIVMKKYLGNFEQNKPEVTEKNVIKLVFSLLEIMKIIHNENIVHRDMKPANLLVDKNNNLVLSDFGIAHFDPEKYENTGHTIAKQYLGNKKFSAPEQYEPNAIPAPTMDIYSFGQIIQWYVTGKTHLGTGRKKLSSIIKTSSMEVIDNIIDICLRYEPSERYQNVYEIYDVLKHNNIKLEEEKETKINFESFDNPINTDGLDYGEQITVI